MRFLTLEVEKQIVKWDEVEPGLLKEEARCIYDLQQADIIRQIHFNADSRTAVIEWECTTVDMIREKILSLPLVRAGYIEFEIIPIQPYTGYNRLFR